MERAGTRKSTPRTRIWPQGGEGKGEGKEASDAEQAPIQGSADSNKQDSIGLQNLGLSLVVQRPPL